MQTRYVLIAAALVAAGAAPLDAQRHSHAQHDSAHAAHAGEFPDGWSARADRGAPIDEVYFRSMNGGFHAMTGPAAIFWDPAWAHRGEYRVGARFTQNRAPAHPEAYGLIFGGNVLGGENQRYSYFLVRNTGEFFVATRNGGERVKNVDWTAHDAIRAQADDGRQVNALTVDVGRDEVAFLVNGVEVARLPRGDLAAEGIFGFRVNHRLDVYIDQIER